MQHASDVSHQLNGVVNHVGTEMGFFFFLKTCQVLHIEFIKGLPDFLPSFFVFILGVWCGTKCDVDILNLNYANIF